MEVAIVSDTHVSSRRPEIPAWVREEIRTADHVVHAGDFDSPAALATVTDLATDLTAVAGNTDRRVDLPAVATVELGGVEFVVTHGTGSPVGYEERVAETVRDHETGEWPAVGIAGHTHEPLDTVTDGRRLLNPGSATGAPPATTATMLTAEVAHGDLTVEVHGETV